MAERGLGPLRSLRDDYFAGAASVVVSFFADFLAFDDLDFFDFLALFSAFGASALGAPAGAGAWATAVNVTAAKIAATTAASRCFIESPLGLSAELRVH
jgi:hypothetical protein